MDRVDAANHVVLSGKRKFADKNLGTNTPGTNLGEKWHNGVQESVVLAVEEFGLVPSHADDTQLLAAIKMASGNAQRSVTSNTTLVAADAGMITASASGGNVTLTLPAANAANGRPLTFIFARTDNSANTLTVTKAGGDSLLPGTLLTTGIPPFGILILRSDGSAAWYFLTKPAGRQIFTSSGAFTVPVGVSVFEVEVWGGGGGSSASSGPGNFTNGGGGGGYAWERIGGIAPGVVITVTVGAGGTASASGVTGGTGGTSSFGPYCSATGGAGGSVTIGNGSASGTGVGSDLNLAGGSGAGAIPGVNAGNGGNGANGGAGGWGGQSVSNAGAMPGGGAGGAGAGLVGSAGAPGLVIVRWG